MRTGRGFFARPRVVVAGAAAVVLILLATLTGVSPAAGATCAPLLALAAAAATHRTAAAHAAAVAAGGAALVLSLLLVALWPGTAVLAAAGAVAAGMVGAAAWPRREAIARVLGPPAGALLCGGAVAAVALWPRTSVGVAIASVVLLLVWRPARHLVPRTFAWLRALGVAAARPLLAAAALVVCIVLAGLVAAWPATVLVSAIVAGVLVLAWRRPAVGLAAAVLLFAFEGSVKILLGLEDTPLPGGNRAVGAAALDLALFGAIAAALMSDRLRSARAIWSSATRLERIVIGIIAGWLALSVLQIAQGGDIARGLYGFRLFQAYTLVALGALAVFAAPRLRPAAVRGALAVGLAVSLYAALRVLIGPAESEEAFALSVPTVTTYGGTVRSIGSFSSAIGLSSFLTPLAVFALVLGSFARSLRPLAWTVAAAALVGLIGSYSRASLFGVAFGITCVLVVMLVAGDMTRRRKLASVCLVIVLLAATYGGVLVASQASPVLRERASSMLDPLGDESVRLRVNTWERTLDEALDRPLGQGVGAAGGASDPDRTKLKTTDNSFLKVLVDQGVAGFALFICGMAGAVILLTMRLRRAPAGPRTVGLAALGGFVAFLAIASLGETVEQPGKVVAWGLLGLAAAVAFNPAPRQAEAP